MTSPQPTPEPAVFQVWPLARVLAEVRCGSEDWTWEEEWADLDLRHAGTNYLVDLTEAIRIKGITRPVLIGSDGRLWDGHHRLRIAVQLGIEYVPVELAPLGTDHRLALSEALGLGTGAPWDAILERAKRLEEEVSALSAKLERVRVRHRESCLVGKSEVPPIAFECGTCEELDAQPLRRLADEAQQPQATSHVPAAFCRSAEQDVVIRVIELFERWVKAGPPPLGTSIARWWDTRLAELHGVIAHPADPQTTEEAP